MTTTTHAVPTTALVQCSGFWTLLLAVVHVATTPLFYGDGVSSLIDGGVVGAVDADPALATLRGAAFWYATVGIFLGMVGALVLRGERRGRGAPDGFAAALAVTGVWGVVLSPVSGFWAFFPIAWLAHRSSVSRRSPSSPS